MSKTLIGGKNAIDIIKENILRVMIEETTGTETIVKVRELAREPIIPESWEINPDEFFMEGLRELQEKGLVTVSDTVIKQISITEKGRNEAEIIFSRHTAIEKYLLRDLDEIEAHRAAHVLEHMISEEVIENMKRITSIEDDGGSLLEFNFNEGIISALKIDDTQLFERMISMGVCPGQRIKIIAKIAAGLIVKLKHTQIAIDRSICDDIKVTMG